MWWPAIGGLVVGLGGLIFPQALGVGYDTIGALLQGRCAIALIARRAAGEVGDLGGVAGIGNIGRRAGAVADDGRRAGRRRSDRFCPHEGAGFWPLVSMGAILGGTMRSPFTGIMFALELTHDINMLLPLLVAAMMAHGIHGAAAEAVDPDRESGAARISSQPRILRGSAGDPVRARSDAHQTDSIRWYWYDCRGTEYGEGWPSCAWATPLSRYRS